MSSPANPPSMVRIRVLSMALLVPVILAAVAAPVAADHASCGDPGLTARAAGLAAWVWRSPCQGASVGMEHGKCTGGISERVGPVVVGIFHQQPGRACDLAGLWLTHAP